MGRLKKTGMVAGFLFLFLGLLFNSNACIYGVKNGLSLCLSVIIPSLFVFTFCSLCLVRLCGSFLGSLFAPVLSPLFNVSPAGVTVFILGLLGGYPLGAKLTADLYRDKKIEKDEAERLLSFCNNAGPMFIIGSVGAGFLGNAKTGAMLYFVHVLSAVTVGVVSGIFSKRKVRTGYLSSIKKEWDDICVPPLFSLITDCAKESVKVMASVCANILLFQAIISLLNEIPVFSALPPVLSNGLLELSSGVAAATGADLVSVSAVLSFGGLCVLLQTESVISGSGLSSHRYLFSKISAAACAAAYTKLFTLFGVVPVFSPSRYFAAVSVQGLSFVLGAFLLLVLFSIILARKLAAFMNR